MRASHNPFPAKVPVKVPAITTANRARRSFFSRGARILAAVLALAFAATLYARSPLTPRERVLVFEKIWKDVDEHYYDPEFGGVNWRGVRERYLPLVQQVKSDQEFYVLMDRMTAELHDAHTRFSSPEQWANRRRHQGVSVGFRAGFVEGKVVVLDVTPNSNAAKAGVQTGWIVKALDGKPMEEELTDAENKLPRSSSERVTKLRILSLIFSANLDKPVDVSLERADGTVFEAKYSRELLSNAPQVISETLPDGFGYIRFDEFQRGLVHDFRNAVASFRKAPGLILDLRRNRGGDGATLGTMAGFFFEKRTLFERRMSRRQVSASQDGHGTAETEVFVGKRGEGIYKGPLVILISEYSASATEVFSAGMQDAGRATLVGTQSCGCVLGITHDRTMKGGGVLEISEVLWFSPKGRKLEGAGVNPDREAAPTVASLREKRDVILQAGEKTIEDLAARRTAAAQ
jgi:carboxyl-terminal processing protease